MIYIKNKHRNRLQTQPVLRMKLIKIQLGKEKMCLAKQASPSH